MLLKHHYLKKADKQNGIAIVRLRNNSRPPQRAILTSPSFSNILIVKERESFLDWISKIDFEKSHDEIYAKKYWGTGDWLIRKHEF